MGKLNSRAKGARGEREFAEFLKDHGIEARRGQQFAGGTDSPDVITELTGVHFEVKRVERLDLAGAIEQATRDAGSTKIPIVAHKRNGGPWLAILRMDDLIDYLGGKTNAT